MREGAILNNLIKFIIYLLLKEARDVVNLDMQDLECSICFGIWDSKDTVPRLLSRCGHIFCENCLKGQYKPNENGPGGSITCPICDTNQAMKSKDEVNEFPKIFALISLGE